MKHISLIIKVSLTVCIILVLVYSIGPTKIILSFKYVDKTRVLKAFTLVPAVMFLGSLKWFYLVRGHGLKVSYFQAFRSFFFGMGIGVFTPGKTGEFTRILLLPGGTVFKLSALVIYDRLIDLAIVVLLAMFSVFFFAGTTTGLWYMVGVSCLIFLIVERKFLFGGLRHLLKRVPLLHSLVKEPSAIMALDYNTIYLCFFIRILLSFIDLFQFYLLINAFYPIELVEVLLSYPPMLLISVLPFTIGGLGIRESFSVYILSSFGIPATAALNSAFLLFCINTLFPGLIGVIFAYNLKIPGFKEKNSAVKP